MIKGLFKHRWRASVAAGLSLAFAAPGLTADKLPTSKAACEKAHMKWDDSAKTFAEILERVAAT